MNASRTHTPQSSDITPPPCLLWSSTQAIDSAELTSEVLDGASSVSIPLNCIARVREFEKGHTKGWEDKFGFVVTYRYPMPN
jgi:hypothetical protein